MTTPAFDLIYPRPMDVTFFCDWLAEGDHFFRVDSPYRSRALMALRGLIHSLDLPESCETMRHEVMGGGAAGRTGERHGLGPRQELKDTLFAALRVNGYIFPAPSDWARTPLTAKQLHIVRLLVSGHTLAQCSPLIGIQPVNVRERLRTARRELGMRTTYQLIAHACRSRWIPDAYETLSQGLSGTGALSPGYLVVPR